MLTKLVGAMDRERFSTTVISLTDRGRFGEEMERSGIVVHTLGMQRGRPDIIGLPRLIRILKQLKPTIVQSWLYHADFLSTLAVQWSPVPALIWNLRCSDMDLRQYSLLTRLVQRMLARWSGRPTAVVVNSEAGRRLHERLGYHPHRWEVIPNGFDLGRFRPDPVIRSSCRREWQVPDDAIIVGFIARLDPMKDHATFLEAAEQIANTREKVFFLLVGKGTEKLGSAIATKRLSDKTRLLEHREKIEALLAGVDILCLCSVSEGFPNVLGEAMACGIPCVSTDVGDARSIIGHTGLVVPVRDPNALAHAIVDLVDRGAAARAALGWEARKRIETHYSLPTIVSRYEALYSEMAEQA